MSTANDYQEHHFDEEKEQVVSFVDKLKFFIITSVGRYSACIVWFTKLTSCQGFFSDGWLNGGFSYSASRITQFLEGVYLLMPELTPATVVTMVGYTYWNGGSIPSISQSLIKAGLSIGMIAGMVVFGFFGDAVGRHKVYGK
jgi:hypothetical protein